MRAIDVLRERRLIGVADYQAAKLFAELPESDPRCLAAHRELAEMGADVKGIVLAVVFHDRLPRLEGRSAPHWQESQRSLDALERGLERLVKVLGLATCAPERANKGLKGLNAAAQRG